MAKKTAQLEDDEKKEESQKDPSQVEAEPSGSFGDYLRVFHYADKLSWTLYLVSLITSIVSGAALPLLSLVFGSFVNKFGDFATGGGAPASFEDEVDTFVLWFIYLFVGKFVVSYVSSLSVSIAALRTTRALREAFLEHTLRQEIWYFDKQASGAVATQVTTNGNRINQGIAEKLAFVVQALSMFFSSFIIALTVQWKLSLITMSVIPAIFVFISVAIAIDSVYEAQIEQLYSQAATVAQEAIGSVKTVHAFWAREKMVRKYDDYLEKAHHIANKKSPLYGIVFSAQYFCVYSGIALCFWQGFRMYLSGEVQSVGNIFTVVFATMVAATSISTLVAQFTAITGASAAASGLFRIMDKPSELDPLANSGKQAASCDGHIEVNDVTFAYPSRPGVPVLKNLTMSIPAGKTTAIVGASGCGKSTLVGLLERWYNPDQGSITLDGVNIADYNTNWLRSRIRLVQQEPVLFSGTVFDNVAKGLVGDQRLLSDDEKMKLVREACISSNADGFIQKFANGYHTQVGERAGMLSGGQRQRIAIARSVISDPKILLLDEATSALDPKAERVVQDALDKVSMNRTTLVIAHRLATIKKADSIAVMANGILVEQGTHAALLEKDGYYAALVAAQDLGNKGEAEVEFRADDNEEEFDNVNRHMSLQQTKSVGYTLTEVELAVKKLDAGTLNYSLLRCIIIMLAEQKSLYIYFVLAAISCIIGGATFPAQAILFSKLLTIFQLSRDEAHQQANFYSLMFFIVALANLLGYFLLGVLCNIISQTVTHRYRREMFQQVLQQDMDFFDQPSNTSGALTSKLSALPTQLQELIGANVLLIVIVLVNIVSSSILAIAYGWKLGLVVVLAGLPPMLLAGFFRIRLETKIEVDNSEAFAESAGLASEAVTNMRTVASLTLEKLVMAQYNSMLDRIVRKSIASFLWTMFWFALSQATEFLVMALGFWYGGKLLSTGEYSTTQFYVIFLGVIFAGQAAAQFFSYSTSITKAGTAANYILWLRTLKPAMSEDPTNRDVGPDGDGDIDLVDVGFHYKQRAAARVLKGISMTIQPGQYIAFVGPSGCGKSTLISLLERFYDPITGRINLNNKDIATMSPRRYRHYMSLVQQEPTLYQGSVRENVCLGLDYEPSEEQLREACRQANAIDFIVSLPESFNTLCGTRGIQFSGGQRQRLAIARAMIRNPRLLLLDEATSALDTQSERIVQATLDEAAASRTTVAVAHRLSTIRNADVIFVMENGRIVEMGTHGELQKLRGRYYEMCLAQSLDQA